MIFLYKFFLYQFLLIKRLYKKKNSDANISANTLLFILYFLLLQNISITTELIFNFKGLFFYFKNNDFPLAPIGGIFAAVSFMMFYFLFKMIKIKNHIIVKRKIINKISKTPVSYSYIIIGIIVINALIPIMFSIFY